MPDRLRRTVCGLLVGLLALWGASRVGGQEENQAPDAPQAIGPQDGASVALSELAFQLSATDGDGDRIQFKIIVAQPEDPPPPPDRSRLRFWEFDQTRDTTGWDAEDYESGATATFTPAQGELGPGTYLWWALAHDGEQWGPASDQQRLTLVSGAGPDADANGEVDDFELLAYIDRWAQGEIDDFELLGAIDWWATGQPPAR